MSAQNARYRVGPAMVAIFGSALVPGSRAHDVDVTYHGMDSGEAGRLARAWAKEHRPDLVSGQGDIAIDLHEAAWISPRFERPGYFAPLQAVEETDPVEIIVGQVGPGVMVDHASLPRAVRFYARHGRLPNVWRLRVGLDGGDAMDSYFGGGLQALATALSKCSITQVAELDHLLGPVFTRLRVRAPSAEEIAGMARGFPGGNAGIDWYSDRDVADRAARHEWVQRNRPDLVLPDDGEARLWRVAATDLKETRWCASTTHGPTLTVRDGVIVEM